jgi:hypothetical protein
VLEVDNLKDWHKGETHRLLCRRFLCLRSQLFCLWFIALWRRHDGSDLVCYGEFTIEWCRSGSSEAYCSVLRKQPLHIAASYWPRRLCSSPESFCNLNQDGTCPAVPKPTISCLMAVVISSVSLWLSGGVIAAVLSCCKVTHTYCLKLLLSILLWKGKQRAHV